MDQLARNLDYLLARDGVSATRVAESLGCAPSSVMRIRRGLMVPTTAIAQLLAAYFDVTLDDLAGGQPPFRARSSILAPVPCLSAVQAATWATDAAYTAAEAPSWLACPAKHGPRTYALRIEGDSMANPGGAHSYEPGDVVYVDPSAAVAPGCRVAALLAGQSAVTIKAYVQDDGRRVLKSLNPAWQPRYVDVTDETALCGVVLGKWVAD